jgi:uncharacterized 2Fe-2S/4Fe-4S cluster protein (DUF4445 family)
MTQLSPHAVQRFQIDFEPVGRRGLCRADQTLLDAARELGVALTSDCGGQGICGQCRVQVAGGRLSEATWAEQDLLTAGELAAGYRLACTAFPLGDCKLAVPPESLSAPMRVQVAGIDASVELAPAVRACLVQLEPPTLHAPEADAANLLARLHAVYGLDVQHCTLPVLRELSTSLRAWHWRCQAIVRGDEVIAVRPVPPPAHPVTPTDHESAVSKGAALHVSRFTHHAPLGLAVDLGSTSLAGYLVDLETGETLASQGAMNPQISFGEDIISRVVYAHKYPDGAEHLRRAVLDALNQLAGSLCQEAGAARSDIFDAVIVGNTAMHHLLLGLPTRQLTAAPFTPTVDQSLDFSATEVGLDLASGATLHILPNIAGFVGADHVAMLLATEQEWQGRTAIALDVGTNTEISLALPDGRLTSVSCASGPAFEGYHIRDGTRARPGAVERVRIENGAVLIGTIDHAPPAGICGSGILDAVAQLRLAGVLNEAGRMALDAHPHVIERNGDREFVLVEAPTDGSGRGVSISQHDVREVQLAKASIQTGIDLLLAEHGILLDQIERFIIAGAFGAYIDMPNAVAIGMFPDLPVERFRQVGNAAGVGAKLAVLSTAMRTHARALRRRISYLELATHPRFARSFALSCRLRRVDR